MALSVGVSQSGGMTFLHQIVDNHQTFVGYDDLYEEY